QQQAYAAIRHIGRGRELCRPQTGAHGFDGQRLEQGGGGNHGMESVVSLGTKPEFSRPAKALNPAFSVPNNACRQPLWGRFSYRPREMVSAGKKQRLQEVVPCVSIMLLFSAPPSASIA